MPAYDVVKLKAVKIGQFNHKDRCALRKLLTVKRRWT